MFTAIKLLCLPAWFISVSFSRLRRSIKLTRILSSPKLAKVGLFGGVGGVGCSLESMLI